jgi:hypothetical protein
LLQLRQTGPSYAPIEALPTATMRAASFPMRPVNH